MAKYPSVFYAVSASTDGVTEQWVAATHPKEATIAVQLQAGPAWQIKLTDRPLTQDEARKLRIRNGDVQRLNKSG